MDNILPENEYTEVEGRAYLNPQVALDESNTFINNLRATQGRQNQEIITDTQMLGTDVPSNIGGLTGAEGYFTSRYQTPQTNSAVANLRAAAQAAALNQALANEQEMWKKRYQDAYRSYQQRSWDKAYSGGGTGGAYSSEEGEDPEFVSTSSTIEIEPLTGEVGSYSTVDPYTGVVTDVNMGTGANSQRGVSYYPLPSSVARTVGNRKAQGVDDDREYWRMTYTLPSGKVVPVDNANQSLVLGSDGNYYIRRKKDGTTVLVGR